jgi:uncharacterized protein (TIGR02145 family)
MYKTNTMNKIRKYLIILCLFIKGINCYSQAPNLISYQTVIRNGNNELVSNTTVGVRISILSGPEANVLVYQEEHTVKTNINGLAYLTIGNGTISNGVITGIDWSKGPYFIKSETDPTGGKNYSIIVVSQILSAPYAIYANTAGKLTVPIPETDPVFNGSIAKGITATDTSYWNKKLNTTDTLRMLANYRTSINNKLDVKDTSSMLSNYLKKSEAIASGGVETDPVFNGSIAKGITASDTSYWNKKLNSSDTSRMLANYRTSINNKLDAKDTTLMLSNYLKKSEAIVSGGVETDPVFNGSIAKGITATDTSYWNKKLNSSDTSRMLANYRTSINNKLDAKDTTLMLSNYLKKSEAIATGGVETDPIFNGSIAKGITASDTSYWNRKLNTSDTSGMLANYRTGLNQKLNITDTAKMLVPYLRDADTTNMLTNYRTSLNNKLDAKDTTLMLSSYLKKSEGIIETDPLFNSSIAKGITAIDTSYWNRKLNVSDTVGLLDDIQNKLDTTIKNIYNKLESKIDTSMLGSGTVKGNIQYWDGQKWIVLEPGKNGQNLQLVDGSPKWNGPSFAEIVLDSITAKEETKYTFVTAWGKVINDGGKPVIDRGIIYGLNENLTLKDSIVYSGLGAGNFSVNIYNLSESSKYYFRIFASNEQGTNLSNIISFNTSAFICGSSKVLDNNYSYEYGTVNIGTQCWLKENLTTGKYKNGDNILQVGVQDQDWRNLFNGTSGFCRPTGEYALYNGYAVLNSKGICPKGWHIPNNDEWITLSNYLGGTQNAGKKMKGGIWPNSANATNESNFSALTNGIKVQPQGYHYYWWELASFWSSTQENSSLYIWRIWDNAIAINSQLSSLNEGNSVRCIKD